MRQRMAKTDREISPFAALIRFLLENNVFESFKALLE